jgi:hypothetical protein
MKITIDTKEDSAEEIRKAIHLLSALVQGRAKSSNIFEDESPGLKSEPAQNAFANMFGSDTPLQEPSPDKQEEKKDAPEVMMY